MGFRSTNRHERKAGYVPRTSKDFFEESTVQSQVKARVVGNYFHAWATIILKKSRGRLAYVDLFAGPGKYGSGIESTPLIILHQGIENPQLRERLVTVFTDAQPKYIVSLREAITQLPGIETLKHYPRVEREIVDDDMVDKLHTAKLVPTLAFLDPFGYKGLSLALVREILKNWGSDVLFLFNYSRINMGLSNPRIHVAVEGLFGAERARTLRQMLRNVDPPALDREAMIVAEMEAALESVGGSYRHHYRFPRKHDDATSHYLFWVSKNPLGLKIIRDITGKLSSKEIQGVPSFGYEHAKARQISFFDEEENPIGQLAEDLARKFAGRTIVVRDVIREHFTTARYLERNYKDALRLLEASNRLVANRPATTRRVVRGVVSFPDDLVVTFARGDELIF